MTWRNSNSPTPERPTPPIESGQRLATFPRGQGVELRVCLSEFKGRPFISLRQWEQDQRTGDWWPVKGKGCSIRLGEIAGLVEAIRRVEARDQPPARTRQEHGQRPASTPAGQGAAAPPWIPVTLAGGVPHQAGRPSPPEPATRTMPARSDRPRYVDRCRRLEPRDPSTLPALPEPGEGFDEFDQ
jgi:hypothetical protein